MNRTIKRICLGVLALVVVTALVTYFFYASFRNERTGAVAESQMAETSAGLIEYRIVGDSGPFVLFAHGTPGGFDVGTSRAGYRILTPSRPGYLRTPLGVGRTPAEQADAYAALLDSLDVSSVIVMGGSGGGPSAISFAASYSSSASRSRSCAAGDRGVLSLC